MTETPMITGTEIVGSPSQSLSWMAPYCLRSTATQKIGSEKNRNEMQRDAVVEAAVLAQRRHDADGEAEEDGDDRGGGDQRQRRRDRIRQQHVDRLVLDADPEVAAEESAEPQEVAQRNGDVEIEELGASFDELGLVRCAALPQVLEGIARE